MIVATNKKNEKLGVVVIGRNEGERLKVCLESVLPYSQHVVYVDSGSTDNSITIAKSLEVEIVELDMSKPFTAARARNSGFQRLSNLAKNLEYVQFVDGDCEVVSDWFDIALFFLNTNKEYGVTCGRRRERHPEHSIYNLLCDIEWNTPIGEANACGGDAMFRVESFKMAGCFRDDLIAGEEPELCVRIRKSGWHIWRHEAEMTLHDANMLKLSQWWKRTIRAGYAFAEGSYLHGKSSARHWVRENISIMVWAIVLPILIISLSIQNILWIALLLIYPIQIIRITFKNKYLYPANWIYAIFLVFGKFPEAIGQLKFLANLVTKRHSTIIEYK